MPKIRDAIERRPGTDAEDVARASEEFRRAKRLFEDAERRHGRDFARDLIVTFRPHGEPEVRHRLVPRFSSSRLAARVRQQERAALETLELRRLLLDRAMWWPAGTTARSAHRHVRTTAAPTRSPSESPPPLLATGRTLRGHAIVFNSMSEDLGGFCEVIAPEAVERTLREKIDLRALHEHDAARPLGRVSANTLRLVTKPSALEAQIDLPSTSYADDVLESVKRRDLTGMSFAFNYAKSEWTKTDEQLVRRVVDMRVREVSVVNFPAYARTSVVVW
jgi:hypothetical protein